MDDGMLKRAQDAWTLNYASPPGEFAAKFAAAEVARATEALRADVEQLKASRAKAEEIILAERRTTAALYAERPVSLGIPLLPVTWLEQKSSLTDKPPAYRPKVGDVVAFWGGAVGRITQKHPTAPGWHIEHGEKFWCVFDERDLRPATPAERVAAGIDPAPQRPEWVWVTGHGRLTCAASTTVGNIYRVIDWSDGCPMVAVGDLKIWLVHTDWEPAPRNPDLRALRDAVTDADAACEAALGDEVELARYNAACKALTAAKAGR